MQLLLPTAGSLQKTISVVDSLILHDLAQYTIQDVYSIQLPFGVQCHFKDKSKKESLWAVMRIIKLFLGCEKVPFLHRVSFACVTWHTGLQKWWDGLLTYGFITDLNGITFNFYLLFPVCKPNFKNPKYFTVLTKPRSLLVPKLNLWAKVKQYLTVCCENTVRLSLLR